MSLSVYIAIALLQQPQSGDGSATFSQKLGTGGHNGPVLSSCQYWIERAALYGDGCHEWAQWLYQVRGIEALRSIMALEGLIEKHNRRLAQRRLHPARSHGARRLPYLRGNIGSFPAIPRIARNSISVDIGVASPFCPHQVTTGLPLPKMPYL